MEKFTVDLEKVLDDFEFSEERHERRTSSSHNVNAKNQVSAPKNIHTTFEYPNPIPYKRPPFEPINLADADYSAATPSLLPSQQSGFQSGHHVLVNQKPADFQPITRHHLSNQQPSYASGQHIQSNPKPVDYQSGLHILANQNLGSFYSAPSHQVLPNQKLDGFQSDHQVVSNQQPGNFQSGHQVSTSYVLPHMTSGAHVIQKTPNLDMSSSSSGLVQNRTTTMTSGSNVIQNSMDQIYSSALNTGLSSVLSSDVTNLDISLDNSDIINVDGTVLSGTVLSNDSNLDLSLDNVLSSSSSEAGNTVEQSDKQLTDQQPGPSTLDQRPSLPDVATATLNQPPETLDLINDRVLSAIVDSSSSDTRPIGFGAVDSSSSDVRPIGFGAVSKPALSESELNKYLDELEEENSVEEVSSLPVVSTDDEVSSTQSQMDETFTSTTTSSGGNGKPCATNSEFENLLSPESSADNHSDSSHALHSKVDASRDGYMLHANVNVGNSNHILQGNVNVSQIKTDDSDNHSRLQHGKVDATTDLNQMSREHVDARSVLHEKTDAFIDPNLMLPNEIYVSRGDGQMLHGNVDAKVDAVSSGNDDANVDLNQMLSSNVDARQKQPYRETDNNINVKSQGTFSCNNPNIQGGYSESVPAVEAENDEVIPVNLDQNDEQNGVIESRQIHENKAPDSQCDEIPNSLDAKSGEVIGNVTSISVSNALHFEQKSDESLENKSEDVKIPSDEIKYERTYSEKKDNTKKTHDSDGTSKTNSKSEISFDINVNSSENSEIEHTYYKSGEPNDLVRNSEPSEQNKGEATCVNFVQKQTLNESEDNIENDPHSKGLESSRNNVGDTFVNNKESQGTWNDIVPNSELIKTELDNSPTEIINTNYVVEISQPHLPVDPINKNTSPQKSIVDNIAKDGRNEETNLNNIETRSSSVWKENTADENRKPKEGIVNRLEDKCDISSKENIEHVQNNFNENNNSVRENSISNLPQKENNLRRHEINPNKSFGTENKNSIDTEDAAVSIVNTVYKVSNSASEDSNSLSRNSNENIKANLDTNDKYKNNFVHNDLEKTREKNTNVLREQNETASIASCITVSNLKQLESNPTTSSRTSSISTTASNVSADTSGSNVSTVSVSADSSSTVSISSTIPESNDTLSIVPTLSSPVASNVTTSSSVSNVTAPSATSSTVPNISINTAPSISISTAPQGSDEVEIYHDVVSPDCYVEEKSIADSIQNNICDNGTAQTRPAHDEAMNPGPSTPEPREHPPYTTTPKPVRPNSLDLPSSPSVSLSPSENSTNVSDSEHPPTTGASADASEGGEGAMLGRRAPYWVPDTEAPACMQCQAKFTLVKRRHHCRACGQVLCSRCCNRRAPLEYLQFAMERVCTLCHARLGEAKPSGPSTPPRPNPNNPMEYCSTIPPLQQIAASGSQPPPAVLVPVSVLKREGSMKSREGKQVMFSDGIKPGGDLTELDAERECAKLPLVRKNRQVKRVGTPPGTLFHKRPLHPDSNSFIPSVGLPPLLTRTGAELSYSEINSPIGLHEPAVTFAIHRNLSAHVKRVKLDCCLGKKKVAWNITSQGLSCVGQDEVVFLLGCTQGEVFPPRHMFLLLLHIYSEAAQGGTVTEMSYLPPPPATAPELLGSKEHGGFLFIRRAGQCLTHLVLPEPPYLFGVLVHRWEIPWAKLFPLRLSLRLGAAMKCYPCPLLSVRHREPVYLEVGHTIIKLLADFRSYAYTLPTVRGLLLHMEADRTEVLIPRNFYDQVVKAMNHSNESHLAFAGNFSPAADSHLVCVQQEEEGEYATQRIECPGAGGQPEKPPCTGLAFILFNASLKSSDGMTGKACIREDGLMVHLLPEGMAALRGALHDMRDYVIPCGPRGEESVHLIWRPPDLNFNVGVRSCVDGRPLDGVQSIRVHGGTDYTGAAKLIRWTEVFILENKDLDSKTTEDPIDHMKQLSESISRATCVSLVPLLDALCSADVGKFAVRVTIHPDDVGYEAGAGGQKFDPRYMRHLDEGLVPIIHQAAVHATSPLTLELVFRIMEQG